MRRSFSGAGAVLVNLAFLMLLIGPHLSDPAPPSDPPPMTDVTMNMSITNTSESTGKECARTYVGVGFTYDAGTGTILEAPEFLPAYEAGIRVGDVWKGVRQPIVKEGELMTFMIDRNGVRFVVHAVSRKICFEQDEPHGT